MIAIDVAAKRFLQMHALEAEVSQTETAIADQQREIAELEDCVSELRTKRTELLKELRAAARDEGQLPLFDLATMCSTAKAGHEDRVHG